MLAGLGETWVRVPSVTPQEAFEEIEDFVEETGIDLPRFAVLTPFPGTPLFARLEAEGRIVTRDWELYDGQHVVFQPKGMSIRALELGHEAAWKRVYSWGAVARRIWRSRRCQSSNQRARSCISRGVQGSSRAM